MSQLVYVVTVRGRIPVDLVRKVTTAHVAGLKPKK